MGFIGRNGAGKTTTLKSILGLVHPDSGDIEYFGMNFSENEYAIKQKIGFSTGAVNYYKKKKISLLVSVCERFFESWDVGAWKKYTDLFKLDVSKTPEQLSEGMKVKLNLALALSHKARLLILDEPTSGLDPVSRDELLEIFLDLCGDGVSILFSTHITSDLEKCADRITYIRNGRIIASEKTDAFSGKYVLVHSDGELDGGLVKLTHGHSRTKDGYTYLVERGDGGEFGGYAVTEPTLEETMIHLEKEEA